MNRLLRRCVVGGHRGFAVQSGQGSNSQNPKIYGIKDVIAIASSKDGVGKSTTAVNLAISLAKECKLRVGLLDADVYGPSIPTMMKLHEMPQVSADGKMIPIEKYGVKCMSMESLVSLSEGDVIDWRGPMVMEALEQVTRGVDWGGLDTLVVDMPPGSTVDAQISISHILQPSGAVIISTPQDVAQIDARRGIKMLSQLNVPILGILENMSHFNDFSERYFPFGKDGAKKTAWEMAMKFLGQIPLDTEISMGVDDGVPVVITNRYPIYGKYGNVAKRIVRILEELARHSHFQPETKL